MTSTTPADLLSAEEAGREPDAGLDLDEPPEPTTADNPRTAVLWAQRGVFVFPCTPDKKRPMLEPGHNAPGEPWPGADPAKGGFHQARNAVDTVRAWWAVWPDAVPAAVVLPGTVVLDFDDDEVDGYPQHGSARLALGRARPDLGKLVDDLVGPVRKPDGTTNMQSAGGTAHIWTPGGEHVVFRLPDGEPDVRMGNTNAAKRNMPAGDIRRWCDVKGGGTGYIFCPGAVRTPAADCPFNRYELRGGDFTDPAVIPPALLRALRNVETPAPEPRRNPRRTGRAAGPGKPEEYYRARAVEETETRHSALMWYASSLAGRGVPEHEALRHLHDLAADIGLPDKRRDSEIRGVWTWAVRTIPGKD